MNGAIRVVGIGGSLSAQSASLAALKIALQGAAEGGAKTELFDIRTLDLPMYSPELRDVPASVHRMDRAGRNGHPVHEERPRFRPLRRRQ